MKLEMTTENKILIKTQSPKFMSVLKKHNITNGSKVTAECNIDDEMIVVNGNIVVAGEDPINKPLYWLNTRVTLDEGETDVLVPLYDCSWLEANK